MKASETMVTVRRAMSGKQVSEVLAAISRQVLDAENAVTAGMSGSDIAMCKVVIELERRGEPGGLTVLLGEVEVHVLAKAPF